MTFLASCKSEELSHFLPLLANNLIFCIKCKHSSRKGDKVERIGQFFILNLSAEPCGDFPENCFLPVLVAILNVCINAKIAFFSKSVLDTVILTNV